VHRFVHLLAVLALLFALAPASAQTDQALDKSLEYIKTQQQADGSFAGLSAGSTADAVFALVAADQDVSAIEKDGNSAIDYINTQGQAAAQDASLAAKYATALLLAGASTTLADGTDLLQVVEDSYNAESGQYGKDVTGHVYALVALNAAGRDVPAQAVEALKGLQREDGGWSFDGTSDSDTNTTSVAVQALKAAGDNSDVLGKAVEFYRAQQNDDGGFPYSQSSEFGTDSDANSTALTIQALLAAGEDVEDWAKGDNTPLERLLAFQNESGAFRYNDATPEDNPFATYQAVPAVARETLPVTELQAAAQPSATASPAASPASAAASAPTASPSAAQAASPSAAGTSASPTPAASPAGTAQALPDTGLVDLVPMYALVAAMLLLSGLLLRRRQA
jgi:prenyltransferase beta subunit/F0F1-type ATP synthase membrane subunit c/vacuolar-type H+-ATPase subunit K